MRILVVDDEADVQPMFLQRFRKEIRNNELEFAFALSGFEALKYLEQHNEDIHLILADINMPGMSGLELPSQIRHAYEKPPPVVMMITAFGDEENHHMQCTTWGRSIFAFSIFLMKDEAFPRLKIGRRL
jgi:two-component system, chemotaxis family, chemotaxis protein CheY